MTSETRRDGRPSVYNGGKSLAEFFRGKFRVESARMRGFDYASPGSYFVTINTKWMVSWFGDVVGGNMQLSEIGEIVADEWQKTPLIRPTVSLDEWQVMPNHFHGIVVIHESESAALSGQIPFVDWDRAMVVPGVKSVETDGRPSVRNGGDEHPTKIPTPNQFGPQRGNLGSIVRGFKSACTKRIHAAGYADFQWQERFWDRIVRDEDELKRIRAYISDNPKRWNPPNHGNRALRRIKNHR